MESYQDFSCLEGKFLSTYIILGQVFLVAPELALLIFGLKARSKLRLALRELIRLIGLGMVIYGLIDLYHYDGPSKKITWVYSGLLLVGMLYVRIKYRNMFEDL